MCLDPNKNVAVFFKSTVTLSSDEIQPQLIFFCFFFFLLFLLTIYILYIYICMSINIYIEDK